MTEPLSTPPAKATTGFSATWTAHSVMSRRALVTGIFALMWCLFPVFGFAGFLAGIAAIILGSIDRSKAGVNKFNTIGIVTGIVAIVLFIMASIFYLSAVADQINDAQKQAESYNTVQE